MSLARSGENEPPCAASIAHRALPTIRDFCVQASTNGPDYLGFLRTVGLAVDRHVMVNPAEERPQVDIERGTLTVLYLLLCSENAA